MLSPRLCRILSVPLAFGVFIRGNGRRYDHNQDCFEYQPKLQPWINGNFMVLLLYTLLRLGLTMKLGYYDGDKNGFYLSLAFFMSTIMVVMVYGIPVWYEEDCCEFLNDGFFYFRYINRTYMPRFNPDESRMNKIIDYLMISYLVSVSILTIFLWVFIALFPRGPLSLGPLIPQEYFTFPVKLCVIIIHCYYVTVLVCNTLVVGSTVLTCLVYFTTFLTNELRLGRSSYLSEHYLRTPENIKPVYRSLQILHQHALSILGIFLLISNAICMLAGIYQNFVLIRVLTSAFWSVVLEFGRAFSARGRSVLMSWRRGNWEGTKVERKAMRKFVRSCKPILMCYGKQFVVGRVSVLVFYRGITRGTMRALLTTKQK